MNPPSAGQRKDESVVENIYSVGDGGKQPIDVVLVNALREEGKKLLIGRGRQRRAPGTSVRTVKGRW